MITLCNSHPCLEESSSWIDSQQWLEEKLQPPNSDLIIQIFIELTLIIPLSIPFCITAKYWPLHMKKDINYYLMKH